MSTRGAAATHVYTLAAYRCTRSCRLYRTPSALMNNGDKNSDVVRLSWFDDSAVSWLNLPRYTSSKLFTLHCSKRFMCSELCLFGISKLFAFIHIYIYILISIRDITLGGTKIARFVPFSAPLFIFIIRCARVSISRYSKRGRRKKIEKKEKEIKSRLEEVVSLFSNLDGGRNRAKSRGDSSAERVERRRVRREETQALIKISLVYYAMKGGKIAFVIGNYA